jgi:FkbM family methyltransferase
MKTLFDRERPGDINVNAGVAASDGELTYYIVAEGSTMNSFSESNLRRLGLLESVQRKEKIAVFRLDNLLKQYPHITEIDYLNIDAEGYELEILRGINFESHAPKIISIEQNEVVSLTDVDSSEVREFLSGKGYIAIAKNVILRDVATVFYVREIR